MQRMWQSCQRSIATCSDLDAAEAIAVALGARKPEQQPCPHEYRVVIDPAGHPFCLATQIPDP
jgi:hypothetical protein